MGKGSNKKQSSKRKQFKKPSPTKKLKKNISFIYILNPFFVLLKYIISGSNIICFWVYKTLKYIVTGPIYLIYIMFRKVKHTLSKNEMKKLEKDILKLTEADKKEKPKRSQSPKSVNPFIIIVLFPYTIIKFAFGSIIKVCYLVYRTLKLNILGILFPFVLIYDLIGGLIGKIVLTFQNLIMKSQNKAKLKQKTRQSKLIGDKIKQLSPEVIEKQQKKQKKAELIAQKEAAKRTKQAEVMAAKERKEELAAKRKAEEIYFKRQEAYGKKPRRDKKDIGKPSNIFLSLFNFPKNTRTFFSNWFNNLSIIKTKQNRLALEREALLISVDSDDAIKSDVKLFYSYIARDPYGKIVKGHFEAQSKVEVHSYLLSEGYEVYSIKTNKWITLIYGRPSANKARVKTSDLIFFLTQLSTYIKAGIPLVEALKILAKQYKKKSYQKIFNTMIYDLTMGENFAAAMDKQGVAFPKLLINMVKAAEMTGELPEALDNMSDYYTEVDKTKKQMVTALIYPMMVLVLSVLVVSFIILFVIPRFVEIYSSIDADKIPPITTFIINLSSFMQANVISIIIGVMVAIVIFNYLYSSIKIFKTMIQWIVMHIPVFKNIVIYNEVTIFSKTFASLLAHNVFITDSMEILNSITDNEIYRMMILDTVNNLAKGEKISESFKDHWAFPNPAYEMLVTGEKTGQLPEMMTKVSEYYQELHRNAVTRLKTIIEPALIVFLTFVVGGIVLAVVIPMFNMFSMIQQA